MGAVVLADSPPLALGQVRAPPLPVGRAVLGFVKSQLFPCHGLSCAQSLDTRQGPRGAAWRATGGPGHGEPLWLPCTGAIWRNRPHRGGPRGARERAVREYGPSNLSTGHCHGKTGLS